LSLAYKARFGVAVLAYRPFLLLQRSINEDAEFANGRELGTYLFDDILDFGGSE
jgi:hypothetical protein